MIGQCFRKMFLFKPQESISGKNIYFFKNIQVIKETNNSNFIYENHSDVETKEFQDNKNKKNSKIIFFLLYENIMRDFKNLRAQRSLEFWKYKKKQSLLELSLAV